MLLKNIYLFYQNVCYHDVYYRNVCYRNVQLPKRLIIEMSSYRNVCYQNVHYQNVWIPYYHLNHIWIKLKNGNVFNRIWIKRQCICIDKLYMYLNKIYKSNAFVCDLVELYLWSHIRMDDCSGGWFIGKRIRELGKGTHRAVPSFICLRLVWLTQAVILRLRHVYVSSVRPQLTAITEDSMFCLDFTGFPQALHGHVYVGGFLVQIRLFFPFNVDPRLFTFPLMECTPLLPSSGLIKGTWMRSVNGLRSATVSPGVFVQALVPPRCRPPQSSV